MFTSDLVALQTYNQCEVDLFELLCKVLDQNLFTQVDWARNSYYFKDLKVSVCITDVFTICESETRITFANRLPTTSARGFER